MLVARSGEDRLEMGSSMHATAVALVRASVLAGSPQASPGEVRQALFLRFHGHDYDAQTRERIMERLGREENPVDRERWFAFRDGRLRAAARRWLAEHGIEATTAPRSRTP